MVAPRRGGPYRLLTVLWLGYHSGAGKGLGSFDTVVSVMVLKVPARLVVNVIFIRYLWSSMILVLAYTAVKQIPVLYGTRTGKYS